MNGAPFTEMPEAFRRLQSHMLPKEGGPGGQWMVDILSLVLHHGEGTVLQAVELALEAGVPTKTHVLNLLHRLIDPKQTDHPEINPLMPSPWKQRYRQTWTAMTASGRYKEKRNAS
jgi:hypothetical protein